MSFSKALFSEKLQPVIRENVILAEYSTFQIGGPADLFAEPDNIEDLILLIAEAKQQAIPSFILGGGSNTLFHDNGFRGLIIHPNLKKIEINGENIRAESSIPVAQLLQKAIATNLAGMEGWIGLPGSVGGAIRGNAGASGVETKDLLESAEIFDQQTGKIEKKFTKELDFDYRDSIFKKNPTLIILAGTWKFHKVEDAKAMQATMTEILKKRNQTQPKGKSAGCIFKNPAPGISAGKLIDESGCKNVQKGDIQISSVHGNFFLNHGKGTQKDALELIHETQKIVKQKTGYDLHTEIEMLPENPF